MTAAIGRVALRGEAAEFLEAIEAGDALGSWAGWSRGRTGAHGRSD
jgi:hypothetical protein